MKFLFFITILSLSYHVSAEGIGGQVGSAFKLKEISSFESNSNYKFEDQFRYLKIPKNNLLNDSQKNKLGILLEDCPDCAEVPTIEGGPIEIPIRKPISVKDFCDDFKGKFGCPK